MHLSCLGDDVVDMVSEEGGLVGGDGPELGNHSNAKRILPILSGNHEDFQLRDRPEAPTRARALQQTFGNALAWPESCDRNDRVAHVPLDA